MISAEAQYPIGKFQKPKEFSEEKKHEFIGEIESFPQRLRKELEGISPSRLKNRYRPGGWTLLQLINHCADSHMNALIRFKLALTEDKPVIKPYSEGLWAELPDSQMPVPASLQILEGVHARWTVLLRSLSKEDFQRSFIHPEMEEEVQLFDYLAQYAWHGKHHLEHVKMGVKNPF